MSVVNLTPHEIVLMDELQDIWNTIPPSGEVLRLGTIDLGTQNYEPEVHGPVELVEFGHLQNPPPRIKGTWYVVSLPCALAATNRSDFLVPYLEVRDANGRIVGCRMLARPV